MNGADRLDRHENNGVKGPGLGGKCRDAEPLFRGINTYTGGGSIDASGCDTRPVLTTLSEPVIRVIMHDNG